MIEKARESRSQYMTVFINSFTGFSRKASVKARRAGLLHSLLMHDSYVPAANRWRDPKFFDALGTGDCFGMGRALGAGTLGAMVNGKVRIKEGVFWRSKIMHDFSGCRVCVRLCPAANGGSANGAVAAFRHVYAFDEQGRRN
jgi:hypothetical protein